VDVWIFRYSDNRAIIISFRGDRCFHDTMIDAIPHLCVSIKQRYYRLFLDIDSVLATFEARIGSRIYALVLVACINTLNVADNRYVLYLICLCQMLIL
jgi:hypothetical protein